MPWVDSNVYGTCIALGVPKCNERRRRREINGRGRRARVEGQKEIWVVLGLEPRIFICSTNTSFCIGSNVIAGQHGTSVVEDTNRSQLLAQLCPMDEVLSTFYDASEESSLPPEARIYKSTP